MSVRRFCLALLLIGFLKTSTSHAEISKGNQILLNRGFQIQGIVSTYDTFHLSTFSNANYTTVNWLWNDPRSFSATMSWLGAAPGFPWARWVVDETDMPPLGDEAPYTNQLVSLQLADEWEMNNDTIRTRAVNWFNSVSNKWPNTILAVNSSGGQVNDGNLIDFCSRAHPDMICFDTYPWKSVYDTNQPNHIGAAIGGPPTVWYSVLRIYRDISRAFNIPFGSYVQTFRAVEEYSPYNVYRDPSPSELRLNHFGALAFCSKALMDFHYNNGSSSLFTAPGGDSNPNALYYEKADCALRCRNFGKALVRLKPIDEATAQWTTSVVFLRGRSSGGALNAIPLNFYAGPGNGNAATDWAYQRNDPYLTNNWAVTNKGTKNNGQPGDVIISWFKLLDESLDGPDYPSGTYMMVVNGLCDPTGTAADCAQEIKLNFAGNLTAVQMLNPLTGVLEVQPLSLTNGFRQLVLNLNGGDAAMFRISDASEPVITSQPTNRIAAFGSSVIFNDTATGSSPLNYQWQFNNVNISGATTNSLTRTNLQPADAGSYTLVVSNAFGTATSVTATLIVLANPPLFYEPFDYTNLGGPVADNTPGNWSLVGSTTNDFNITGGNLSYPGLTAPIGNSATNGGAGLAARRLFGTNLNSGAVYFSALFRMNNLGFGQWNGLSSQVGALTDITNTNFRLQVMVKSNSASGYVFGVQKGGSGVTAAFDTTEYHANETIFLVGKYDFNASPNAVSLWINPNAATFGSNSAPATGVISATTGTDGFTIDRFNFRQNVASGANSLPAAMQWDELRVGANWASVTPAATSPHFQNITLLPDHRIRLQGSGNGGIFSIQVSSNLIHWNFLTNILSGNGAFEGIDPLTNLPQRFYRATFSP